MAGTVIAGGDGTWSFTTDTLTAGPHTLTATDTNFVGNVSTASAALVVTIDTTAPVPPPAPTLASASDSGTQGDTITNVTTPAINGTGIAGDLIILSDDFGVIGTATVGGTGTWSVISDPLAEGQYSLSATATDPAGNVSNPSATLLLTIDTTAPDAPPAPTLDPASDSGTQGDNITNFITPVIDGTGTAGDTITLHDGTIVAGTTTVAGDNTWSVTSATLGAGGHTLTATETDPAGNSSGASAPLVVTIDTTRPPAPTRLALDVASQSGTSATITADAALQIDGTAAVGDLITLFVGTTVAGTVIAGGDGTWSFTTDTLTAGPHTLTATDTNFVGNVSTASAPLVVTIDTTAPVPPPAPTLAPASDSGTQGDTITNVTTPAINGTGIAGDLIILSDDFGVIGTATVGGTGTWSVISDPLAEGQYSLSATATDPAGNVSNPSATLLLTIDTTAPDAPPAPTLDQASDSGAADGVTNVITPVIDGTGTAGDTITLHDGTIVAGTTTVAGDNTWSVTAATLGAGGHTLTATETDPAGNSSGASAPLMVTIDTTRPPAPTRLALDVASQSGTSATVTADTALQIDGTAAVGDLITLFVGTTVAGTVIAGGDGTWSFTTDTLTAGPHTLTATDTNFIGNVSTASIPLVVTIDTTAPVPPPAPTLAPASDSGTQGDTITNVTTPAITGTGIAGDLIILSDDFGVIGTATVGGTGTWSVISDPLAEGQYSLSATATDPAGNVSNASATLLLTIDTTAPDAPPAPTLDPASDSGAADAITNVVTPVIDGTGTAGDTITLHDGTIVAGTTTVAGDNTWSVTAATLGAGGHTLTATETDPAGNSSGASTALVVTIDTTRPPAPTRLALDVASQSGTSATVTADTALQIDGTAAVGDLITLFVGTTVAGTVIAGGDGTWSFTTDTLTAGPHTLTATDTNFVGNVSTASAALVVTIDTTAPVPPPAPTLAPASDSGTQGDTITNVTTPAINGTGIAGDLIILSDDFGVIGTATVGGTGTWSVISDPLAEGQYSLSATATDPAGNVSNASATLLLTIDTTAPDAPPAPTLDQASDSGTQGDNITNVATPVIDGTGTAGDTITLHDGTIVAGTTTVAGDNTWSVTAATLGAGGHTLTATETDPAGNSSGASAPLVVTIDTTAPVPPSGLTLAPASDSGIQGDTITNVTTPVINGTGIAGDLIILSDDFGVIGTATVGGTGTWSVISDPLAEGQYSLSATATDPAGNVSNASATLLLTIDTTAPDAPSVPTLDQASDSGIQGDNITTFTTPALTGTGTAGDTITLHDGTIVAGTTTVGVGGTWSVTADPLITGSHTLTATETDANGNISNASPAVVVAIVLSPAAPSTPVLAPGSDSGVSGDNKTVVTTPAITGTGTRGDAVTLFDGITVVGTGAVAGDGTWSVTTDPLSTGSYTLTAKQTNSVGDISAASSALNLTISTLPATLPAPVLSQASDSGSPADNRTDIATPVITGSGGTVGDTVRLFDGITPIGTATVAGDGSWSVTTTTLAPGTHALSATQTDSLGDGSAASAVLTLTIDAVPGILTGLTLAPASDSGLPNDGTTDITTPTITGAGGTAGNTVTLYDGVTPVGTATVGVAGTWSVTVSALSLGSHALTAKETNAGGDVSTASIALIIAIAPVPAAPLGLTLSPTSDTGVALDNITRVVQPTITGTASTGDTVRLFEGITQVGSALADGSGVWSIIPTAALAEGSQSLTATATDVVGDESPSSSALTLTIDSTAPPAPTLGKSVANTNPASPSISGSAETGDTIRISQDGTLIAITTAVGGAWNYSYTSPLAAGSYTLTATATDIAGNVSAMPPPLALQVNADNSYEVVTPIPDTENTQSSVYDPHGNLTTVKTSNPQNQTLTQVTDTQALINIYDTAGNLIGTITQPSTSALTRPVFNTTTQDAGASTASGPIGSVVDLLSETNNFVSSGNDDITVHSGTATITATGPSTVVNNLAANVTFYGGGGTATVNGGSGSVVAVGGANGGRLTGGTAGNNVLVANGGTTTLVGVADGDQLFGSNTGTDTLIGAPGNQILVGGGGTETINASAGNVAFGGSGNSTLNAAPGGGSVLVGGSGNSTLVAADGPVSMWAGSGTSTLQAGSGNDVMGGNADINSTTLMIGGTGNATFLGSAGSVTVTGGSGNDTYWASTGLMTIIEGSGNDTVFFGSGQATATGGTGTGIYSFINGHAGGIAKINDFKVGIDQINLFGYGNMIAQPQVSGGNLAISLSDGTAITLVGISSLAANSIAYG